MLRKPPKGGRLPREHAYEQAALASSQRSRAFGSAPLRDYFCITFYGCAHAAWHVGAFYSQRFAFNCRTCYFLHRVRNVHDSDWRNDWFGINKIPQSVGYYYCWLVFGNRHDHCGTGFTGAHQSGSGNSQYGVGRCGSPWRGTVFSTGFAANYFSVGFAADVFDFLCYCIFHCRGILTGFPCCGV